MLDRISLDLFQRCSGLGNCSLNSAIEECAIDPLGTLTQNAYDGFGNQISKTLDCCGAGRLNALTKMSYNIVGDIVSVADPNGNITTST
jgi:hypothetical protein